MVVVREYPILFYCGWTSLFRGYRALGLKAPCGAVYASSLAGCRVVVASSLLLVKYFLHFY